MTRAAKRKRENKTTLGILLIVFVSIVLVVLKVYFASDETVHVDSSAEKALSEIYTEGVTVVWSEKRMQEVLHEMTHQKVSARLKNGAVQMSKDNILACIKIVEASDYKAKNYYLNMLNRWWDGNFNAVDSDHNALHGLLKLDGDTRANGQLSDSEEDEFLHIVFSRD